MPTNFKHELKTRKQLKAQRDRHEAKVKKAVRAACAERDGDCRLEGFGICEGVAEWAHLGEWKRFHTRNMAPEARHHQKGSLILCSGHHRDYDGGRLVIEYGDQGADGPLVVRRKATG
jgi:hypothetical protein